MHSLSGGRSRWMTVPSYPTDKPTPEHDLGPPLNLAVPQLARKGATNLDGLVHPLLRAAMRLLGMRLIDAKD